MSQLLKTLNEQRGAKLKEAQSITEKACAEKRGFSDDERTKLRGLNDEIEKLNEDITEETRSIANLSHQATSLTKQERQDVARFDIRKLLNHMNRGGQGSPIDGIEAEMIQEGEREARAAGLTVSGIALPEMLTAREARDLSVTGGTTQQYGGELVATAKQGLLGDFYNASVLASNGALVLRGLQGNVDLPRYTKASNPTAKAENGAADELSPTFAALSLTPKRLPAFVDISDQLLMQSSAVLEAFLRAEITNQLLDVQEVAFFHGNGTNQPTGIAATSGIGSVVGGTNGADPDWADIIDLESAVANVNAATGRLHYITNTKVRGKLKKTVRVASTDSRFIWDGDLNGYTPLVSNAVSSTLTKGSASGVCSAIFFGNVADFVIGYWGGIMLEMVRDTTGAKAGQRTLVANTYYDAGVLRPKSFAAMLDALT